MVKEYTRRPPDADPDPKTERLLLYLFLGSLTATITLLAVLYPGITASITADAVTIKAAVIMGDVHPPVHAPVCDDGTKLPTVGGVAADNCRAVINVEIRSDRVADRVPTAI